MKSSLTLTSPLLTGDPGGAVAKELGRSALQLERNIKENISSGRKTGRTYKRAALVRATSKRTAGLKLVPRSGGSRVVVGYTFHRASRRGESPAIDTGGLINSIRTTKLNRLRYRIGVGKDYGLPLDDPDGLDRPFFASQVEKFRPVFFENIRRAFLRGK